MQLQIEAGQPIWRPEDGGMRVSDLQTGTYARVGVKAHGDPRLVTDMEDVELPIDATERHGYAAEWDADGVRFFVDDELVRTVAQRIDYPLQLMVDLFEFPESGERDPTAYPKTAGVRAVRGYRRADA